MLLYFSVKNSRSFEHHATLSFVADDSLRLPQNVQTIEHYDFKVLKSATIYGANASGKTNFLKAFVDGISIIEYGLFKETLSSNKSSKQTVATFHPNKNKDIKVQIKKDDSVTAQTRQTGFDKWGKTKDIFYDLLTENSTGTNRFLIWLLPWYQALIYDKILIIDEFGNSMHPILVEFLIKLFHDKKRKAQILFSTHYTELMNRSLFRDDQIWLVNKDHTGNSTLEPLSNYEVPDKVLLDKGYLQGLFKGIPHIADIEIQKARQLIPK
jgi:AAA15 family ATPase/GTPase